MEELRQKGTHCFDLPAEKSPSEAVCRTDCTTLGRLDRPMETCVQDSTKMVLSVPGRRPGPCTITWRRASRLWSSSGPAADQLPRDLSRQKRLLGRIVGGKPRMAVLVLTTVLEPSVDNHHA